jgi:putative ABC transport system substrate-binding protein
MKRQALRISLVVGLVLATTPLAAEAQPAGKVPRIGWLAPSSAPAAAHVIEAFRQGLRDLGYVEGKDILIEYRWAAGRYERLPNLAAELVRLNVDVIFAVMTVAALPAKNATRTIPIVTVAATDPEQGLVASLARPGGNITGLTFTTGPEIVSKQLQLLSEAVPMVSRVALLWNPANPAAEPFLRQVEVAAQSSRLELQRVEVRGPDEFESAFSVMTRGRAGALLVVADPIFFVHRTRLVDLATKSRLPTMLPTREHVEAGGLMGYGPSLPDLFRRAAAYVDKILKGAKPADLPVEQPTTFELIINLKTAKALGLTIPPSMLLQADRVIE